MSLTPSSENLELQASDDLRKFRESDEGKRIAAWIRQGFENAKSDREEIRRQWILNYSFYRSKQNYEPMDARYGSLEGRMKKITSKYARTINRVKPAVTTDIAALVSQKPSAMVIPATSEDADLFAAQAAEQIYESMYRRLVIAKAHIQAAMWQVVCAVGYLKDYWDPNAIDREANVTGDVVVEAITPFHIYVPDLMETEIERQPWVLHAYVKPLEWVKRVFAEELKGAEPLQATATRSGYDVEASAFKPEGVNRTAVPDSCMLYEMWVKPGAHADLPMGGLITMVEGVIVQAITTGLPYLHGEYPFTKLDALPNGTYYSDTTITDIVDLNREFNRIRGQITESIRKMSRLQFASPKGSVVTSRWTNEIGLVVEYTPGMAPPQPLPAQELPSYLFRELEQIITDIEDITGQHQVSKGNVPAGVTAATAISFLQERDDAYRTALYQSSEFAFAKLGRHLLSHAVQFWDSPRLIKTVGADSTFDVQLFAGADIAGATDLIVEPGSALPKSRAARTATIMDLMNMGHIPAEEGLKMMEIGGTQTIVDNLRQDERQAQRENIKLRAITDEAMQMFEAQWQQMQQMGDPRTIDVNTGAPLEPPPIVTVNTWDNHEVHIATHNKFRKSQAFDMLPDAAKLAFETHVQQHQQQIQQQMVQQFMNSIPGDGSEEGALDLLGDTMEQPTMEGAPNGDQGYDPGTVGGDAPGQEQLPPGL